MFGSEAVLTSDEASQSKVDILGSIINKPKITINVLEKLVHDVIIDCKSWPHGDIYGDIYKNR